MTAFQVLAAAQWTAYQQASREAVITSFMTDFIHQENMMNIPA